MPRAAEQNNISREKLLADFKVIVSDVEELLKLTADQAGDRMSEVRARLGDRLELAKEHVADADAAMRERARQMAHATDDYVHANPWQSLGIAAGVAFLIGMLAGRR